MLDSLNVAIIQSSLAWENPARNRKVFSEKINALPKNVDLVVLPEMFTSGFTMNAFSVAETINGVTLNWLKTLAHKNHIAITGSMVIKEKTHFYNCLVFVEPSGKITTYNKRHTFSLAGEDKVYEAGSQKVIIDYKSWKICPLICYDLRFPVWSRNIENYDVLIYVANWPKARIEAWDALLKARAIENMSYCIGVNRVGQDGSGFDYPGHSAAYDVLGHKMNKNTEETEFIEILTLEKSLIHKYRKKLGFLEDADKFTLE